MKKKFTILITAAFMLLTMMAQPGTVWGQTREDMTLTFSLTSNPGGWPTTNSTTLTNYTYTLNNVDYTFALKNVKCNSGYLFVTQVGVVGLPAIEGYKLTKVVASNSGGCSTSTKVGISSSANSANYIDGGAIQTWSTQSSSYTYTLTSTDANTMYYMYVTNKNAQVTSLALTYSPVSSTTPFISADDVEIAYNATSGSIEYSIENGSGNVGATVTTGSDWIELGTVTTDEVPFTCLANEGGERTATVTLTFTGANDKVVTITQAGNPNAPGTQNNPYTVAQARAAIDAGVGVTGVYATGIVSEIVTEWGYNNYQNITFNMVDEAGDEEYLQAFRCVGTEAPNVQVGDVVVVNGNLILYQATSTYEFAQGCSVVSLEHPVITDPYITADDVEITYDATEGEIAYTIENIPSPAGTFTASVPANSWITLPQDLTSPFTFTCDANTAAVARTETVTLTYTYGTRTTTTKEVTVTQAGNPDVFDNISGITEVGTAYSVRGTVVAINNKGFIIGDGTGYAYTYLNATPTVEVGDMVKVSGTTGSYGHIIQFTNSAAVTAATTSSYNNTPAAALITSVPDYTTGYHLSTYLEFEGHLVLSNGNYLVFLNDGDTEVIQVSYPTSAQTTQLYNLASTDVHVKGYFSGINSSDRFTVALESIEGVPAIEVDPATVNAPFTVADGSLTITYENIPDILAFDIQFCDANGDELQGDAPDWIDAEINEPTSPTENYTVYYVIDANNGEARSAYFKVYTFIGNNLDEVYSNLVTINQAEYVAPTPSIVVDPTLVEATAAGIDGTITVTLTAIANDEIEVQWFESDGTTAATYNHDWIEAIVDPNNDINYMINENTGEARSAYFKVYGLDADANDVYSELVTINQAAPVVDYATLPFEYDGNGTGTLPTGFTVDGLGTYSSSPKMQFNSTGDWAILKINERPGVLTFDIKGNSFNGSTFKVQTSTDGATYTDLETYTTLGATQSEEFANLAADVRYIKWIYAQKVNGNVALGNIVLEAYDYTPAITLTQYTYNLNADGGDAELPVTTANLAATPNLEVVFYESDGVTTATYDWITANINNEGNIAGHINANTGDARSAYFKVSGLAADNTTTVYSNLVTINQAAYVLSIEFETTSLDIVAGGEDRTLSFDYEGLGQDPTFSINFYESDGTTAATYDWIDAEITQDDKVNITVAANTGAARSAYFKVYGANGTVNTESNLVTINQAAAGQTASYTLITSLDDLTPGYHYLIASAMTVNNDLDDVVIIMTGQNSNNRGAQTVLIDEATATVTLSSSDDYYDFVISGYTGNWTIYDESYNQGNGGYLYASSNSANQLKTRAANSDKNSEWSITIDNEGVATIVAQGANGRNTMQYNSGSSIFSCYSSASQADVYLYKKTTDTPVYYSPTAMTLENPNPAVDPIIVLNNEILTITGNITCSPDDILIQDGGQLIHDNPINATIQRNIKGYNANRDADNSGYMLIASPVADPLNVNEQVAIISGDYDLYIFDESQPEKEWRNYETNPKPFTTFVNGVGYLYANAANQTISFAGELKPSNEPVNIDLNYTDGNLFAGWNLVGNPFACNAYLADTVGMGKAFYRMNTAGNGFVAVTSGTIAPMEGIFVKASAANQSFKFTRTAPAANPGKGDLNIQVAQVVNSRDAQPISDNAIIRFDGGSALEKFSFRDDNAKIYFTQGNKDYAVVSATAHGEMPVNFKAAKNGTYTIDFSMENVEFSYLHLIDNKTGMDIDLLQTQSYTFEANMSDYASRFRLVFNANSVNDIDYTNNNFGFISNGNLMILGIEGEATLQMIDVTGRILSTETFYGSYDKAVNAKAGVYMLRLIQGENVRTQKIVVR